MKKKNWLLWNFGLSWMGLMIDTEQSAWWAVAAGFAWFFVSALLVIKLRVES